MQTVLINEDDNFLRGTIARILMQNGYGVLEAKCGRQALNLVQHHKPDFVVTDIFMDDGDGIEFICDARSKIPGVKIIAISSSPQFLEFALELGADAALRKPFRSHKILQAIKRLSSPSRQGSVAARENRQASA